MVKPPPKSRLKVSPKPPPKPPPKAPPTPVSKPLEKLGLHPRNRHRGRYDFPKLAMALPALNTFLVANPFDPNEQTIDFANPEAVKTLNAALLKMFYKIQYWDIPPHYLCPPIPGRADYLHQMADLLASSNQGMVPRGPAIHVLDVGVGANCIYPIIGQHEYGWHFLGTDIDPVAINAAQQIVNTNAGLASAIELRLQTSTQQIFDYVLKSEADELFDFVICNPPFHASLHAAQAGSYRKWKNLSKGNESETEVGNFNAPPALNFGGQGTELWCDGGEVGFVSRMIEESVERPQQCFWFSALISKEANLPLIYAALKQAKALKVKTIDMAQGQKKSRIVAWSFLNEAEVSAWRNARWQ